MQSNKQTSENLTLKTYEKKVKEDIRLIHENLHEMLKLVKIEDDRTMRVICTYRLRINYFFVILYHMF